MSKRTLFLFFIILLVLMPSQQAEALGIGPPSFELDVPMDGSNSTMVYITSDGLTGELIVGKEGLPFRVEPSRINMTSGDVNKPVELTFYGNQSLEPGVYEGKVTFLAYTGGFVALGVKIKVRINLYELIAPLPGHVEMISTPENRYEIGAGEEIGFEYVVDFKGSEGESAGFELNFTYPSGAIYEGYSAIAEGRILSIDVSPIAGASGVTLSSKDVPFGRLTLSVMFSAPEEAGNNILQVSYRFTISKRTAIVDLEEGSQAITIQVEAEAPPSSEVGGYSKYIIGVVAAALLAAIILIRRR